MLKIENLTKSFQNIKVLDNVNLKITKGQIFGLIGESGCGKSTLGKIIMRFFSPTSGNIYFKNKNILQLSPMVFAGMIQMIFQEVCACLNPRMTVYDILSEPFIIHKIPHISQEIGILLDMVKIERSLLYYFPHQLSGGQRQRIAIARALALRPELIICDEPTSSLDLSIQAQILNLLKDLQKELNLTCLFISHDFNVIKYMCKNLAVMKGGKIVETGKCQSIFSNPQNEYTQNLLSIF
jgi:peptide/nickel transport system ATP-binding protein